MLERARDAALHARGWFLVSLLFVFDMDDVLYDYDWRARMAQLTAITGHGLGELRSRWWHRDGELAAEAGRFGSGDEYLAAANRAIGADIDRETWVRIRGEAMTPRDDAIAAAGRAAAHGVATLLTNNGPLIGEHLADVAPALVPAFGDHLFATAHYGARKPDPVVFRRVLDAYGADAASTFFADDRPENVEGARSLGIESHLVTDSAGLRAAIDAFIAARG
jgi:glucose-1-phosphatase